MADLMSVIVPIGNKPSVGGEIHVKMSRLCATCKHKRHELKCLAYPEGIPERILSGKVDHTRSMPGDRGIVYEPIRGMGSRR